MDTGRVPYIGFGALGVSTGGWVLFNPLAFSDRRSAGAEEPPFLGREKRGEGEPPYMIWVRVDLAGDLRFVIAEVHLTHARQRLTADHLRAVPLGRIETICNTPPVENWISAGIFGDDEDDVRGMPNFEELPYGDERAYGPPRILDKAKNERGRYPDEFYETLAIEYGRLALANPGPARLIAEANDVPVSTVYRWLKEARRREIMPPARKGPRSEGSRVDGEHQETT